MTRRSTASYIRTTKLFDQTLRAYESNLKNVHGEHSSAYTELTEQLQTGDRTGTNEKKINGFGYIRLSKGARVVLQYITTDAGERTCILLEFIPSHKLKRTKYFNNPRLADAFIAKNWERIAASTQDEHAPAIQSLTEIPHTASPSVDKNVEPSCGGGGGGSKQDSNEPEEMSFYAGRLVKTTSDQTTCFHTISSNLDNPQLKMVVGGGPGTGKSLLIKRIIEEMAARNHLREPEYKEVITYATESQKMRLEMQREWQSSLLSNEENMPMVQFQNYEGVLRTAGVLQGDEIQLDDTHTKEFFTRCKPAGLDISEDEFFDECMVMAALDTSDEPTAEESELAFNAYQKLGHEHTLFHGQEDVQRALWDIFQAYKTELARLLRDKNTYHPKLTHFTITDEHRDRLKGLILADEALDHSRVQLLILMSLRKIIFMGDLNQDLLNKLNTMAFLSTEVPKAAVACGASCEVMKLEHTHRFGPNIALIASRFLATRKLVSPRHFWLSDSELKSGLTDELGQVELLTKSRVQLAQGYCIQAGTAVIYEPAINAIEHQAQITHLREILGEDAILLTISQSKGLDFDHIILVDLVTPEIAHRFNQINKRGAVSRDAITKEDRAMVKPCNNLYTACTRARQKVSFLQYDSFDHQTKLFFKGLLEGQKKSSSTETHTCSDDEYTKVTSAESTQQKWLETITTLYNSNEASLMDQAKNLAVKHHLKIELDALINKNKLEQENARQAAVAMQKVTIPNSDDEAAAAPSSNGSEKIMEPNSDDEAAAAPSSNGSEKSTALASGGDAAANGNHSDAVAHATAFNWVVKFPVPNRTKQKKKSKKRSKAKKSTLQSFDFSSPLSPQQLKALLCVTDKNLTKHISKEHILSFLAQDIHPDFFSSKNQANTSSHEKLLKKPAIKNMLKEACTTDIEASLLETASIQSILGEMWRVSQHTLRKAITSNLPQTVFISLCEANLHTMPCATLSLIISSENEHRQLERKLSGWSDYINARNTLGHTALYTSCVEGKTDATKILLKNGADARISPYNSPYTPLYAAVCNNHTTTVETLLQAQPGLINTPNTLNITALHISIQHSDIATLKVLLKYCDAELINLPMVSVQTTGPASDLQKQTLKTPLYMAVIFAKLDAVQLLLQHGACYDGSDTFNPLIEAARHGHPKVMRALLESESFSAHMRTKSDTTPLHAACLQDNVECVELLINEYEADVLAVNQDNCNALHFAAQYNTKPDIIELLLGTDLKKHINDQDKKGFTPLSLAITYKKDLAFTLALLKNGADPTIALINGMVPLYIAVTRQRLDIMEALVQRFPMTRLNKPTKSGVTILHCAAQNAPISIIRFLLENGLSGDATNVEWEDTSGKTFTPLGIAIKMQKADVVELLSQHGAEFSGDKGTSNPLHKAMRDRDSEMVKTLIKAYPQFINTPCEKGLTALHYSINHGQFDLSKQLLEHKADPTLTTPDRTSPLHCAAYNGYNDIIDLLLESRQLSELNTVSNKGYNALHFAAFSGQADTVAFLLDKGMENDIDAQSDSVGFRGMTPLCNAASNGHTATVLLLLERGAKLVTDNAAPNPLFVAAKGGHTETIKALLANKQFSVTQTTEHGTTILLVAIRYNHMELAYTLLDDYKADLYATDNNGVNALHAAAEYAGANAVSILLERGLKPQIDDQVDNGTSKGATALFLATKKNDLKTIEQLLKNGANPFIPGSNNCYPFMCSAASGNVDALKLLLSHCDDTVNIDTTDDYGFTALSIAANSGKTGAVKLLLKLGASTICNKYGYNPLHEAARKGCIETAEALLQSSDYQVDMLSRDHKTALCIASTANQPAMVIELLQLGANPNMVDGHSRTPLMLSIISRNTKTAIALIKHGADQQHICSHENSTAFFTAAQDGNVTIIRELDYNPTPVRRTAKDLLEWCKDPHTSEETTARMRDHIGSAIGGAIVEITPLQIATICGHSAEVLHAIENKKQQQRDYAHDAAGLFKLPVRKPRPATPPPIESINIISHAKTSLRARSSSF